MTEPVSYIRPVSFPEAPQAAKEPSATGSFQAVLEGVAGEVERSQSAARKSAENFLSGGTEELHSVVLAAQRASLEFDLFLQTRNKVVAAYQQIMNMQL